MAIPESAVFPPKDPTITNDDDWPIYELHDVAVQDSTGRQTSLFEADSFTPVTINGILKPLRGKEERKLLQRIKTPTAITVSDVSKYAYGQFEDGAFAIWAAGQAGWFEIKASGAYEHIYNEMVEAITVLYFVADRSRDDKRSYKEIFLEWASQPGTACANREEAAADIYKHRRFLISSMMHGKEGVSWGVTSIYQHLRRLFPDDLQAVRDKVEGRKPRTVRTTPGETKSQARANRSVDMDDESEISTASSNAPKKDEKWWCAKELWEFMQRCQAKGWVTTPVLFIGSFIPALMRFYEFDRKRLALDMMLFLGPTVAYMMEHKKHAAIDWMDEPVYTMLKNAKLPISRQKGMLRVELKKRPKPRPEPAVDDEMEVDDAPSTPSDFTTRSGRRVHHGQLWKNGKPYEYTGLPKSALRPKLSGQAGKRITAPAVAPDVSDDENQDDADEDDEDDDMNDQVIGEEGEVLDEEEGEMTKQLLRSKRKQPDDHPKSRKRKTSRSHSLGTLSPENSDLEGRPPLKDGIEHGEDQEDPDRQPTEVIEALLPLRQKESSAPSHIKSVIPILRETPLPATTANGPGDTWLCPFDGCVEKVYGASKDTSQAMIKEHYGTHALEKQKQIDVLRQEEGLSRLPVNHLIQKIREAAERKQNPLLSGRAAFPVPVERSGL